jgi:drug/metabolite transporter (DMT)-like permease
MTEHHNALTGSLLIVAAAGGYSFFPIFTRYIYRSEDIAPLNLVFWRFVMAVALAWCLVALRGQLREVRQLSRHQVIVLLGLGAIFSLGAFSAVQSLEFVPAATHVLLFYTFPSMVAVISWLLGERLSPTKWAAIGVSLLGCLLTVGGDLEVERPIYLTLPLVNALAIAVYMIVAGRYNRTSGLPSGAMSMSGTLVAIFVMALIGGIRLPETNEVRLALVGQASISTVLPIVVTFIGITYIGATNASIINTVEPVFVIILAGIFLDETVGPMQLLGGTLIIASVVLLHVPTRRRLIVQPQQ